MRRDHPSSNPRLPRVCIIGAGSTGIAVARALREAHIPFVCFEAGSRVGGNWVFQNDNGMSAAYRSLHINTSRERMEYRRFPMPADYPDYPHHSLMARYFQAFVEHFGLLPFICFKSPVERVTPVADGTYEVVLGGGGVERFDVVVVANGHHWDPRLPDPAYEGEFSGIQMHSHPYQDPTTPHDLVGKRVVVVGMGNSAMDIACELGHPGVAEKVFLSARRGAWVLPKYLFGKPLDQALNLSNWLPRRGRMRLARAVLLATVGSMQRYGLPEPDHLPGEAHPTISSELLVRLGSGDVLAKPDIARLLGDRVAFVDGSSERVDAIVYCTGYRVSFPFFDTSFVSAPNNELPLFMRAFKPGVPNLFFAGLCQPLGAIMPIAELQGEWLAEYLTGRYALPAPAQLAARLERERMEVRERYGNSPRHTMQVDFDGYMAELGAEMVAGRRRARARGYEMPVAARVRRPALAQRSFRG